MKDIISKYIDSLTFEKDEKYPNGIKLVDIKLKSLFTEKYNNLSELGLSQASIEFELNGKPITLDVSYPIKESKVKEPELETIKIEDRKDDEIIKVDKVNKKKETKPKKNDKNQEEVVPETKDTKEEEEFKKLSKVFEEVLPERDIMSDDLLSDIENMSLDKTQKIKISDIPDLDDVDLPKIKKMDTYDEDIWKKQK